MTQEQLDNAEIKLYRVGGNETRKTIEKSIVGLNAKDKIFANLYLQAKP